MKYGDYILRLWDGMGEPHTMWYISLEDAQRLIHMKMAKGVLLVRNIGKKYNVVFACTINF
jgi:hypothetical protein